MLKRLVVTSEPHKDENLRGFVLRTSEENGYESPYLPLRYAKLDENEIRNANLPLQKLAKLYGCKLSKLKHMEYVQTVGDSCNTRAYKVNGHEISAYYLRTKNPQICPKCIEDAGYIDMFWDLKYAVVCPRHNLKVIDKCPSCGKMLSWNRPGLLICRCGFNYMEFQAREVTDSMALGFQELIWRKFSKMPISSELINKCKFPISHIEKMSLATLLGLIERLARINEKCLDMPEKLNSFESLSLAAYIFSDWPKGLFCFLHKIGRANNSKNKSASIIKQFNQFYNNIFRSTVPSDEIIFIKKAFVRFAGEEYKDGRLDKRIKSDECELPESIVGIYKISEIIGVRPVTVKRLVKYGIIDVVKVNNGERETLLFDVTKPIPRKISDIKHVPVREIGRRIGLPVSVMHQLRSMKVFKVNYLAEKVAAFHHKDVAEFEKYIKQVINKVRLIKKVREGYMTISAVMRKSPGGAIYKANVISAVLFGKLGVHGRLSDKINGLVVNRSEVESLIREFKVENTGSYSDMEVAKILSMDIMCLDWLVSNGHLSQLKGFASRRITIKSVDEFHRSYISCIEIAKKRKSSSTGIIYKCRLKNIEVLYACRKNSKSRQPFIRREDLNVLNAN